MDETDKFYAEVDGRAYQCSSFNIEQLKFNYAKAREDSDHRTAMRISRFIDEYYEDQNPFVGGFFGDFDDEFDEDDEDDDFDPVTGGSPMDLFEHLPTAVFEKLQKKLRGILEKNPPERMIKIINKSLSKPIAASILTLNPDAFVALLILHAAAELGIDTGVTGDQVIEFCDIGNGSEPPSFPFF